MVRFQNQTTDNLTTFNQSILVLGAVTVDCNFYQGTEGCKTRWADSIVQWNTKCRNLLKENKLEFEVFFKNASTRNEVDSK